MYSVYYRIHCNRVVSRCKSFALCFPYTIICGRGTFGPEISSAYLKSIASWKQSWSLENLAQIKLLISWQKRIHYHYTYHHNLKCIRIIIGVHLSNPLSDLKVPSLGLVRMTLILKDLKWKGCQRGKDVQSCSPINHLNLCKSQLW